MSWERILQTVPQTDIPRYQQLFRHGRIQLKNLITDFYPLEQINEALDAVRSGAIAGRCMIHMDERSSDMRSAGLST